jgi:hypothetical protein
MLPNIAAARTVPEPTVADLDAVIEQLRNSWTARITVRRQSLGDVENKDIYVSLDGESFALLDARQEVCREVKPGPHRLRVHNTLFWKTIDVTVQVAEHASFVAANRAGFGTYSMLSYLLGTNLVYLTLEREQRCGNRV